MNKAKAVYYASEACNEMTTPMRTAAKVAAPLLDVPWPWLPENALLKNLKAACEIIGMVRLTHDRVRFGIDSITASGQQMEVTEEVAMQTPFCTLLHLKKDAAGVQPRVLLVAPMSGHFATLLRGTVRTLLRDHDVYVTDWHNVRDTPLSEGTFDVDDYTDHIISFLEAIGPGTHLVAVCQPVGAAIAAAALMAEDGNSARPASMTLMAGPVDCRINPTEVNRMAVSKPFEWFENNLVTTVPLRYDGAGRRVYPGVLQLSMFMSMNIDRHMSSFGDMYKHLLRDDFEKAEAVKTFYEEYFAVMDLPAEYYLQTIRTIFQEYHLAQGKLQYRGRHVDPAAIQRTALFTVEGEKDDICSIGQTVAAQDLCSNLRPYMRRHHVQTGVGHYGVFNGKRWENEIYPRVRDFIYARESLRSGSANGVSTAAKQNGKGTLTH